MPIFSQIKKKYPPSKMNYCINKDLILHHLRTVYALVCILTWVKTDKINTPLTGIT